MPLTRALLITLSINYRINRYNKLQYTITNNNKNIPLTKDLLIIDCNNRIPLPIPLSTLPMTYYYN